MSYFIMDFFRNPLRGCMGVVVGLGALLVLLFFGIPHAGSGALAWLGGALALVPLLIVVGIPMRFVIPLMLIAIAIVGSIGVLRGLAVGGVPWWLLVLVAVPVLGARRWFRAHVHRPIPPSHGAQFATWRKLKKGGF